MNTTHVQLKETTLSGEFLKAISLHHAGDLDAAEAIYRNILASYPEHAIALHLLGMACVQRSNWSEAIGLLEKSIALKPDSADAYFYYSVALISLERYDDALAGTEKAIALKPDYAEAYNNRGRALHNLKRFSEAMAHYDKAIALNPDYSEAYHNRGLTFHDLKQYGDAVANYDKVIALTPDYTEAYYNRGLAFYNLKQYGDAMADYDKAIALKPDLTNAHKDRGIILYETGRYHDALASFEKAIASGDDAEARWYKSLVKLLFGEYEEGWRLYEWRWKCMNRLNFIRTFQKPKWLGKESLTGKTILLHAEQGFGDALQFCRYIPMVCAKTNKIIFECYKGLTQLMQYNFPDVEVVETASDYPGIKDLPDHDYHTPLMSLPHVFGTTLENILSQPYLKAQPEFIEKWRRILNEKTSKSPQSLRIGLCWAGGQRPDRPECLSIDARRSLHFKQIKPLLDARNNMSFISLQLGPPKSELDDERVMDISSLLESWSDTAAVIALLDLVITVDTSVCHLAAAMGKPVFLLNRYDTCWRWLLGREDSPWYPSLRLFRQQQPHDWDEVIEHVKAQLKIQQFSTNPL